METAKKTPLTEAHRAAGGKIVEFAGFMMPLQYSGVMDEHKAVREAVGLFDVSHMGQVFFRGPGALDAAHRLVTNNVLKLEDGEVLYSPICYEDGGIVDDCLVYRIGEQHVLIVVNASNVDKDFEWFVQQTGDRCEVVNASDEHALLALQGPQALAILADVAEIDLAVVPIFGFAATQVCGVDCVASRTGYTGEDGFEISCAPKDAPALWSGLMTAGAAFGIKPCGLGARDTLRLEARLCLYGNDIDATTSPLEAGLGWTVKLKAGEFIGHAALKQQKKAKVTRKLVCLEMRSRGIARQGHAICRPGADGALGQPVGQVTSGTKSPTLGVAIAMGYVPAELSKPGTGLVVDVRGKAVEAEVIKGPFYRRPEQATQA
jgi:aminomethyltransferase